MSIRTINPATNQELKSFDPLTKDQTIAAVEKAHEAFQDWRNVLIDDRAKIISKVAATFREEKEELAKLITLEMGKRIEESRKEIDFCANIFDFYADGAAEFLSDEPVEKKGAKPYLQYAPIGVLLGVMPWNFPFYQVTRFAAPNLMAGNTVLLKHASNVPQCAKKVGEIFERCGLPAGCFTNLFIPSEFVEAIMSDDRVQGASVTGSERAGAAVAGLAGKNLKRSVMELGGNDAFIVLDDADLENAIQMAVKGRMVNTGQSCVAAKRFIVLEEVAQPFIDGFKEALENMKMGDPMDEETEVGPLSTEGAAKDLLEKVQRTIDAGATVLLGGDRPDREGAYFNPTILTDITPDMPSFDEELFGPVASIYVVKDEAEAIELANHSSYGLGGSVYSKDLDRAERVARQIDTGMMFINEPTNSQAELPFGGTKRSGYGRELSHLAIYEFVNKKLIHRPE